MVSFDSMCNFEVLQQAPAPRECVDGFPQSDQSSSRHAKPLAGWAFELNVHFQPLVWSQQRGFTARLDKIKVQRHVLEVRPLHGPNGHTGRFCFRFRQWGVRLYAVHHSRIIPFDSVKGSAGFYAVVNGKTDPSAALTSFHGA